MKDYKIIQGDCRAALHELEENSVQCVVTSPPYWGLRDYKLEGAGIGLEKTLEEYIDKMVAVFQGVRRVLRDDGTVWLNMGDAYCSQGGNRTYGSNDGATGRGEAPGPRISRPGLKPKDLIGLPWRVALALQADGWWLRRDIIWHKPNPMPESVNDRPAGSHEYVFLLTKRPRYYYDAEAVRQPAQYGFRDGGFRGGGRYVNNRAFNNSDAPKAGTVSGGDGSSRSLRSVWTDPSVWTIPTESFTGWTQTSRWVPVERGGVSCGMKHTVFPDCPHHGDSSGSASTVSCGGRASDESSHTECTGVHHDQERIPEPASTGQPRECCSGVESSDSLDPQCAPSATRRNTRSRKKVRAPETSSSCNASAETSDRTGDKSALPERSDLAGRTPASNIEPGDSGDRPSDETVSRIVDKSSLPIPPECTCLFYHKTTQKTSHFATFPRRLVEPCIKAGTSNKGCCPKCGAGWVRVVEKHRFKTRPGQGTKIALAEGATMFKDSDQKMRYGADSDIVGNRDPYRHMTETWTVGWEPGCKCFRHEPLPCTVLDPFCGSGTTGVVATQLGRRFTGIELNPDYCEMARRRIENPEPVTEIPDAEGQQMMFEATETAE